MVMYIPLGSISTMYLFFQVLQGQSIDGTILALKMLCITTGLALPTLLMDTSYAVSSHWKLFTGQVCTITGTHTVALFERLLQSKSHVCIKISLKQGHVVGGGR